MRMKSDTNNNMKDINNVNEDESDTNNNMKDINNVKEDGK